MQAALKYSTFALGAALSYQLGHWCKRLFEFYWSPLHALPGPPRSSFLFGTFFVTARSPFMKPQFEWWEKAGKLKTDLLHYSTLFGVSTVLLLDADYAKQMLTASYKTDDATFVKRFYALELLLGRGLVTLNGTDWFRHRRIVHSSFQFSFIKNLLNRAVPHRIANLLECWEQAGPNRTIDISTHFSMLTLDILGEVAFGHDFRGMQSIQQWAKSPSDANGKNSIDELPEVSDRLVQSLNASIRFTTMRMLLTLLGLNILDRESARTQRNLNDAVSVVIKNARKQFLKTRSDVDVPRSKYKCKSILENLLDAQESQHQDNNKRWLSNQELQAEVKTFLVAGHETTSTWCHWAVHCLCQYQEIQERVFMDIIKHSPDLEQPIDVDTAEKMTYLSAFLMETLRMYCPVGMIVRHTGVGQRFGSVTIPQNTKVAIPVYLMHRSPRYWEDPEEFLPERWLKDTPPHSHPYAFLPFSHGPRNCIGHRFATMEAKLILAPILRRIRFEWIAELKDKKVELSCYNIVKAEPSVRVNARVRQKAR